MSLNGQIDTQLTQKMKTKLSEYFGKDKQAAVFHIDRLY